MLKVKLTIPKHVESPYSIGTTAFCWVSAKQPDGSYHQISKPASCKDYVHDVLHNHHLKGKSGVSNGLHCYNPKLKPNLDTQRMRLLMLCTKETTIGQVYTGKRILNIIENKLGWRQTSIRQTSHPQEAQAYILTGPKEWMEASFFMSIVTLILRACSKNPEFSVNSWEEVEQNFAKWINNNGQDGNILVDTYKKILPILMGRKSLMSKLDKDDLWPPDAKFWAFHNPAGFQYLCKGMGYCGKANTWISELKVE